MLPASIQVAVLALKVVETVLTSCSDAKPYTWV